MISYQYAITESVVVIPSYPETDGAMIPAQVQFKTSYYQMGEGGKVQKFTPTTDEERFHVAFTAAANGVDVPIGKDPIEYGLDQCKKLNDAEVRTLQEEIQYWTTFLKTHKSSEEGRKYLAFNESMLALYVDWYRGKKIAAPKTIQTKACLDDISACYIDACDRLKKPSPNFVELEDVTGKSRKFWRSRLLDPIFLAGLSKELDHKINQAKKQEKKVFWSNVQRTIDTRLSNVSDAMSRTRDVDPKRGMCDYTDSDTSGYDEYARDDPPD